MNTENIQTQNFRNSDPFTSQLSGEEMTNSGNRAKQLNLVVQLVGAHQGLTSKEFSETKLAKKMGLDRTAIGRRLSESMLLVRGEHRKCRINGSQAVTWWLK